MPTMSCFHDSACLINSPFLRGGTTVAGDCQRFGPSSWASLLPKSRFDRTCRCAKRSARAFSTRDYSTTCRSAEPHQTQDSACASSLWFCAFRFWFCRAINKPARHSKYFHEFVLNEKWVSTNLDIRITSVTLRVNGCKVFALLHVNLQCTLLEFSFLRRKFCFKKLV